MRRLLKHSGMLLTVAGCMILAGCATKSKTAAPVTPKAPDPLKLAELPDYGAEKTGYDKSANCLVLGRIDGIENAVIKQICQSLSGGLAGRGYGVQTFNYIDTAEDRQNLDKIVRFQYYSLRSQYLPTKAQTATDIYLVVSVTDVPDSVLNGPPQERTFYVFARDIAGELDPALSGLTTKTAVDNAVANLFCLDGFCQALESKDKKQTVASQ